MGMEGLGRQGQGGRGAEQERYSDWWDQLVYPRSRLPVRAALAGLAVPEQGRPTPIQPDPASDKRHLLAPLAGC